MGIDINVTSPAEQTGTRRNRGNQQRDSEFWMNLGKWVPHPIEPNEQIFVSLGGFPWDELTETQSAKNDFMAYLEAVRNEMVRQIKPVLLGFEPGQEDTLTGLEIQVRRTKAVVNAPANTTAALGDVVGKIAIG